MLCSPTTPVAPFRPGQAPVLHHGHPLIPARVHPPELVLLAERDENQDYGHWFDDQAFGFSQPTAWRLMALADREDEARTFIPDGMNVGIRTLHGLLPGGDEDAVMPSPAPDRWHALDGIAKSIRDMKAAPARDIAAAVPEHRRAGTARTLRDLGTYLGAIALALEEMHQ